MLHSFTMLKRGAKNMNVKPYYEADIRKVHVPKFNYMTKSKLMTQKSIIYYSKKQQHLSITCDHPLFLSKKPFMIKNGQGGRGG